MDFLRKCAGVMVPLLAAVMAYTAIAFSPALAGVITTDQLIEMQVAVADRERVNDFLKRSDVRRQMIDLGVDPGEVDRRISGLSDGEIRAVADRIDQMPAGQGAAGILILVAVVVFAVFIVTDLIGMTDVFPFINSQSERKP